MTRHQEKLEAVEDQLEGYINVLDPCDNGSCPYCSGPMWTELSELISPPDREPESLCHWAHEAFGPNVCGSTGSWHSPDKSRVTCPACWEDFKKALG